MIYSVKQVQNTSTCNHIILSYQATGLNDASVGASANGIMSMVGPDAVVSLPGSRSDPLPVFEAGASAMASVISDLTHYGVYESEL